MSDVTLCVCKSLQNGNSVWAEFYCTCNNLGKFIFWLLIRMDELKSILKIKLCTVYLSITFIVAEQEVCFFAVFGDNLVALYGTLWKALHFEQV